MGGCSHGLVGLKWLSGAGMMAQQVKVFAYKVYELRSVVRTHVVEGKTDSYKFSDLHICALLPCPINKFKIKATQ